MSGEVEIGRSVEISLNDVEVDERSLKLISLGLEEGGTGERATIDWADIESVALLIASKIEKEAGLFELLKFL